jgi:hypothetical protein
MQLLHRNAKTALQASFVLKVLAIQYLVLLVIIPRVPALVLAHNAQQTNIALQEVVLKQCVQMVTIL